VLDQLSKFQRQRRGTLAILKLDENFELHCADVRCDPVLDFFTTVLGRGRETPWVIESMLENGGVCFESGCCEMFADPGEEPFEGVKFSRYYWNGEPTYEVFISEDEFYDALLLVVRSHLHTHSEDEAKLRTVFAKHQIPFEASG